MYLSFAGALRTTMGAPGRIEKFIASLEPDIVGLIETDGGSSERRKSQPGSLAEVLGRRVFTQVPGP